MPSASLPAMTSVDQHTSPSSTSWWRDLEALDHRLPDRWRAWGDSPAGGRTLADWQRHDPRLSGWSIDALTDPVSSPQTDAMQAALVALTQAGSAEAGLTLLVQLRPGLIRLARAARAWEWIMNHDVDDEVQATFLEVLFRHDLTRRPERIAANLLLDTRQKLWRRVPRAGPPTVGLTTVSGGDPGAPDVAWSGSSSEPAWVEGVELWLHLRESVKGLGGTTASRQLTATMAYRAWIEDEPTTAIATDLGVAPQTVATRLYRLRRILRAGW